MKLADNLLASFTSSVTAYPEDAWNFQCGLGTEQDIKIMYKTQNESTSSGSPTAVVCASASFLVPLHMGKAFELLKNNMLRAKVPRSLSVVLRSHGMATAQSPVSLFTLPTGGLVAGSGTSW
jgi:hypothetical protein